MSVHCKKSKKSRGTLPSEVFPHFRDKVETLTDSEDEHKSSTSDTESAKNDVADENPRRFAAGGSESMENIRPVEPNVQCAPKKSKKRKSVVDDFKNDIKPNKKKKKDKEKSAVPNSVISQKADKIMKKDKEKNAAPNSVISQKADKIMKKDKEKNAAPNSVISQKADKIMKKFGYKTGEGLGKDGQGRVAPVDVSKQKGRRGLGFVMPKEGSDMIRYNAAAEVLTVEEKVSWLNDENKVPLGAPEIQIWVTYGKKKRKLDDETNFCDPEILKRVLICKSAFDKMSGEEMRRARSRANPYELIKKGPFLNRAAMKMANMDSVFDYMFTNPVDEFQNPLVKENELLYFADVCAGPGGFSEYVLWRRKWRAKGFGFTLKGDNDFKLEDFYAGPCESFEPYYGKCGDGDIYKPANIKSYTNHVMKNTDDCGVHFMMADGGFSVEGQENIQEILSKRIYLCQCLVALSIVRKNGHFVCKLFDIFTPFSVGIIYLMYKCFKKISIHKPNTSRPANSERYLICKWRNKNVEHIRDYLKFVNKLLDLCHEWSSDDINEVVPIEQMKKDENFFRYILNSNDSLGKRQINSLAKILKYSDDETLIEEKQNQLKKDCMDAWKIPIIARRESSRDQADSICRRLLDHDIAFLRRTPKDVLHFDMSESLYTVYDWHAVILGSNKGATFYLGASHKKCYKYEQMSGKWTQVVDLGLELSPDTLVYGEIVPELIGQYIDQRRINVFHIIDGYMLGGINISQCHYTERIDLCALYAKALTRPSLTNVMPIRMKNIVELDCIENEVFLKMENIQMKNSRMKLAVPVYDPDNFEQYFIPKGIMFLKATKAPYRRFFSRTNNLKYYWAPRTQPLFDKDRPKECIANVRDSYAGSFTWYSNEDEEEKFILQNFPKELVHFVRTNRFVKKDEK